MNTETQVTFKEVINSFKNWPRIFRLLKEIDKKSLVCIMIFNIIGGLIPALLLIANQYLINSISFGWENGFNIIVTALLILMSLYIAQLFFVQIQEYIKGVYILKLSNSINILLMKKSINLSLADFEDDKTYDQLQRAQSEASSRPYQILEQILSIINGIVTLVSTALILIFWKWWLIILLLIIPLCSAISFLKIGKREFNVEWARAPLRRKQWYLSYLLTKDMTIKEIKLYGLGPHLLDQYKQMYTSFLTVDKQLLRKRSILSLIFGTLNQLIMGGLMLVILTAAFTKQIMIGTTVSYIQALASTQNTAQSLLRQIFSMYENNLYVDQLFSFLDVEEKDNIQVKKKNKSLIELENVEIIEFKNVSFKYPDKDNYVLEQVSFRVKKGDVLAIVGKNGSGKSTLVKLLTRLYEDFEGEILINSKSISLYSKDSLQSKIGVVFQDFIKYELTARENIGFGDITQLENDKHLYRSAYNAGILDLVNSLPNRIDTQLGKWFAEGFQLSGGQWQKVAISRAFCREADLYILDEPSSALDASAENEVFNKFHTLIENKIGIYISHRFSTVKHATQILVFDKGKIIEKGTHDELLNKDGLYCELYELQASAFLTDKLTHSI